MSKIELHSDALAELKDHIELSVQDAISNINTYRISQDIFLDLKDILLKDNPDPEIYGIITYIDLLETLNRIKSNKTIWNLLDSSDKRTIETFQTKVEIFENANK